MPTGLGALGRMFTIDKTVDSYALNRLGAQAFRTIIAHGLYAARPIPVPAHVAREVRELKRQGILVIHDFLAKDLFERVKTEAEELEAAAPGCYNMTQGWTHRITVPIRNAERDRIPAIQRFLADPRLVDILWAAEQRPLGPLIEHSDVEVLRYMDTEAHDDQNELHSDCFFNTHKVWFYLRDVGPDDGPLGFVRGSNVLTLRRLRHIYRESWDHEPDADASRRVTEEEERELPEESILTTPANTLVIVNTCGYHRRHRGVAGHQRSAICFFLRANPFAPHALHWAVSRHPRLYAWLKSARRPQAHAPHAM
jgi:hypothetical protein